MRALLEAGFYPGGFFISADVLYNAPDVVQKIMGRCVIVRAEYLLALDEVQYTAFSPDFQAVPEGCRMGEYVWQVKNDGEVVAERVE